MTDKYFAKFLKNISSELKEIKPSVVLEETILPEETEIEKVARYLSTSQKIDDSIPFKNAELIQKSTQSDRIPAAPENIEVQRWNDPLVPLDRKFVTFKDMNDHYNLFLNRIQQQMSTLSGGGEVRFSRLDDVNASTFATNKYLTYDPSTRKFVFDTVGVGEGIILDENQDVALAVATETTLGGIKLGPGVELNGLDQIVINPEGLDFSFGDFFAYTANGASGESAAYLSSINDNQDIVIQSNGTGQIDIIGRFGIFPVNGPISERDPVFAVSDDGDVSATTLNIINSDDLGLRAPLNVTINEQGLTKTPAVVTGSVAQFTGRDDRTALIVLDSYGIDDSRSITGGEFVFRTGRGTNETPAAVQENDILGNITAAGWASNGYGGVGVGGIRIIADEDFNATSRGSRVEIYSTPRGTITPIRTLTVDDTGIVFNTDDVTGISNVDYMVFDVNHTDTANTEGVLAWSSDDKTLNIHHEGGVVQQVGQELYAYVRNGTANTIPNGTAVQFAGAEENRTSRLLIAPMLADGSFPSLYGLGIATQNITSGADGRVTVWGKVRNVNTSAWNIGDILYISPSNAGQLTNVKPTAPNNVIPIAAVLRKDATEGEIFVRPTIDQQQSYGRFARTTDISVTATNTANTVQFDTTEISNGVSIVSGNTSRLQVNQSGLYQIDVSAQVDASGGGFSSGTMYMWLRKNGSDIADSTRRQGVLGSAPSATISFTLSVSLDANDYIQVAFAGSSTALSFDSATATAFAPSTAAVLVGITQIQL
jgi:hypothetical protein